MNVTVTDVAGQEATDSVRIDPTAAGNGGGGGSGQEGFYDPQADGGNGGWIATDDSGNPVAADSPADAANRVVDNGVASNANLDAETTTSDVSDDAGGGSGSSAGFSSPVFTW